MRIGLVLVALLLILSPYALLHAQETPSGIVGWYNGDWQPGIPGWSNWYVSESQFALAYDDFVVPDGGWTIVGVFAHNTRYAPGGTYNPVLAGLATEAFWEIRSGVSEGNPGALVASGRAPANEACHLASFTSLNLCRIQVDKLSVVLEPGKYWLSVAPVAGPGESYLMFTLGGGAVGEPWGGDGQTLSYGTSGSFFHGLVSTGGGGTSSDCSMGVLISATPPALVPPATAWRNNIAYLALQMPRLYSLPFPGISLTDFNANAAGLSARIPSISDAEIRTGLQALVASIEDPHTDVGWGSPSPFRFLPLSFYWFDDGIYVTAAPLQYRDLLGGRVVSVGNVGIDEATQRLASLVPHENDSWLKYSIPLNKLVNTDFLNGLGVTDNTDGARIQVQSGSGDLVSLTVPAMNQSQFPSRVQLFQGALPLYRQNPAKNYWATAIDGGATVYFQYNSCNEDPKQASADFFKELDALLSQDGVQRVIVDMRNNTGGFVSILNPWIDKLKVGPFNRSGRLYVIVGRATFSAAMYASDRFRQETSATFVGEPTGGKPRFMNRQGDFPLPYFGIRVSYSNGVMNASDYGPTLMPDIQTGVTFQDYMNGVDPALDAILSLTLPGN